MAFTAIASQWRVTAIGGGMAPAKPHYIGLDYAGVEAGLRGWGIDATPDLWAGISVMEAAMRGKLNGLEPSPLDVTTDGS